KIVVVGDDRFAVVMGGGRNPVVIFSEALDMKPLPGLNGIALARRAVILPGEIDDRRESQHRRSRSMPAGIAPKGPPATHRQHPCARISALTLASVPDGAATADAARARRFSPNRATPAPGTNSRP